MTELTVKEYAERERVTTRTVRTWIAKGAVKCRRTHGGHLRIVDQSSRVVVVNMKDAERRGRTSE